MKTEIARTCEELKDPERLKCVQRGFFPEAGNVAAAVAAMFGTTERTVLRWWSGNGVGGTAPHSVVLATALMVTFLEVRVGVLAEDDVD